ncbi:glycosyltransferase [Solimicrobium silvestre]|uniref:Glycosyl transferases group 1 n=1 Tax=Solimicrobium silvestre TaxID=2099400 RepID=A0A2S9H1Y7_9BURK|nr:glycosyltransferase [Solimicrobium silvestre]PRC93963.1 Glycosyl transferases group 1 [Solimicrobium silvestre]
MNFILFSDISETTINKGLGLPEYSYYFVLKSFHTALSELGTVTIVQHPETEVDALFEVCQQRDEECLFLSFSPPNKTLVDLKCPTISVFAWEYSNIPTEQWDEDLRNDWRTVFACHGRTIALSGYTVRAVQDAMGVDFPVLGVPTPLWNQFSGARERLGPVIVGAKTTISLRGTVLDSRQLNLSPDFLISRIPAPVVTVEQQVEIALPLPTDTELLQSAAVPAKTLGYRLEVTKRLLLDWYREVIRDLMPLWFAKLLAVSGRKIIALVRHEVKREVPPPEVPEPIQEEVPELIQEEVPEPIIQPEPPEVEMSLGGVVYTSVFSPKDGRKNWFDMVTAFCWTFRDVEDATLVLKMNAGDLSSYQPTLITLLSQLSPFKCRVVTVHGFLDDATYEQLIGATTYYVNTSLCEGLCLPLLEFMSCGKPVIAPGHTAMEDYIDESVAFMIKSGLEHNVWPHDPRDLFRTLRYRLDWSSICTAYWDSYQMARNAPQEYQKMSNRVLERLQSYASVAVVKEKLQNFFQQTNSRNV